jgi:hypothetical protein
LIVISRLIQHFGLTASLALFLCAIAVPARSATDGPIGSDEVVDAGSCLANPCSESWVYLYSSLDPSANTFPGLPARDPASALDGSGGSFANFAAPPVIKTEAPSTDTKFRWRLAIQQSLLFTGIMHGFNLASEAGTRDALNGPWLNNYLSSVSELRGWSDGDTFMAPYVGHTIEGSTFGFVQRRNDPKYRNVQWGDGRDYFVSVLRSMAFSAVWHTQWKIGPISEASIGNVMLHASPGFITLVDTPTLGAVAMMGEDAVDRYLIMGLENRTANRTLLVLVRSFLNPGRASANLLAFTPPWQRENRPGVFRENFRLRQSLLADYRKTGDKPFEFVPRNPIQVSAESSRKYPLEAPIELTAFPYYENIGGHNCIGGGGSGAARINPSWQVVAEMNGCLIMNMPQSNQSADSLFYGGGARWTPLAAHRISPFAELLFGGKKVTHETDDEALRKELMKAWDDGKGPLEHYPKRSDWSVEVSNNGPSIVAGGGLDVVVTRPFAWRVIQFEYSHTWMNDVAMIHPQNSVRISTGAVLRIGTW